jgi:hypothetical protein
MTDPQLSLIVTDRIDPRDQVTLMPGTDAVCECATEEEPCFDCEGNGCDTCADTGLLFTRRAISAQIDGCRWPFCNPPAPPTKEDA